MAMRALQRRWTSTVLRQTRQLTTTPSAAPKTPPPQPPKGSSSGVTGVVALGAVVLAGGSVAGYIYDASFHNAVDSNFPQLGALISSVTGQKKTPKAELDEAEHMLPQQPLSSSAEPEDIEPEAEPVVAEAVSEMETPTPEAGEETQAESHFAQEAGGEEAPAAGLETEVAVEEPATVVAAEEKPVEEPEVVAPPAEPVQAPSVEELRKQSTGKAVLEAMEKAEVRARELRLKELEYTTQEVTALNVALRRELEATFLADAHTAGVEELRNRVASLVTILQERTRYEALRISEALRRAEEESARKYNALLEEQRNNLVSDLNEHRQAMQLADVRAREEALTLMKAQMEEKYEAELRLRIGDMERIVQQQLKRQELEFNAAILDKVREMTKDRAEAYDKMALEVAALRNSVEATKELDAKSVEVHKVTAAALSLAQKFETNEPFLQEATTLAKVSSSVEPEILTLIEQLPQEAMKKGIPTLSQLQYRFHRVKQAARHESNVPQEMPGFGGQIIASVATFLTVAPKGLVKGEGPEERLARAGYYVQTGELAKATSEISGLTGRAKTAVQDWLKDAECRIKADQIGAAITLQAASMNQRQLAQ